MRRTGLYRGGADSASLSRALKAWRQMLGATQVQHEPELRASYERATFPTSQRVAAIVRPGTVAETRRVLAIATRERVPIHPVSRGLNWGYGSRVPREDGSVVLELSRLRKISDLDDELGTVTVQAGVSFAELAAFLHRRGSTRMLSVTGGSPHGSVLANALERGIGFGATGNRIETLCALEIVLATGELVRTGFARYPGARAARVQRLGLGPALDGLFAQSNLGVATAATIWLAHRPRWAAWINVSIPHRDLATTLSIYRGIYAAGTLRGVCKITNGYSQEMNGVASASKVSGRARLPPWHGFIYIAGDDQAEIDARLDVIERGLRQRPSLGVTRATVCATSEVSGPYVGAPSETGLAALTFGRPPLAAGASPEPSGVVFLCPAVPLRGAEVKQLVELLTRLALAAGFLPYVTLNLMDERAVHVVFGLIYDREVAGLDARAMATYRRAFAACVARGYYPYRLGVQSMGALPPFSDDSEAVIARLRAAVDPAGILGRGLYQGRSRRRRRAD